MSTSIKVWRTYGEGRYGQMHITCAQPIKGPGRKTPVICFHQSPISGSQFRVFQEAMAEDRLVLCPDTPGFGGSDAPGAPVTIPDYAGAMADMLENLGYGAKGKGPVDVVGCHTGTLIGTALAVSHPNLVRKIAFASLGLFNDAERAKMKAQYGGPQPILTDPAYVPKAFDTMVMSGGHGIQPERRLEMFAERLRSGTKSWYGPEASLNYDCETALKQVTQPVLLLVMNEMLGPNTRRAKDFVKNATVSDVSAWAEHNVWDEHPHKFADEMRGFFDA
ncbi:MAG: alpha/beta hydrolase [Rhodospirillaceae bacterium]|nr:alpha/beta hydrolase [Rhodospirillaceae bacterium]